MFLQIIILILTIAYIRNEQIKEDKMVGLKALHDIQINKDTIITRNMNLKSKYGEKGIFFIFEFTNKKNLVTR